MKCIFFASFLLSPSNADIAADLVTSLPGFANTSWPFKLYSGLLDVPGPVNGYDSLLIHYQFHTSQKDPTTDPVVTWHQGGPGGSSINTGLYGEMGAFQIGDNSNYLNPWAWNRVANMLYLDSPAGSGGAHGYSQCIKAGKPVACKWDDKSQAEAYAHTLLAFYKSFPEFQKHDLYMTGESYAGQYVPNIARFILDNFEKQIPLKGLALGNACWGGNSTCVVCNGPSEDKLDVELLFGHGMYSPKLHNDIYKECSFPTEYTDCSNPDADWPAGHSVLSARCKTLLTEMRKQAGPYNIYFMYDNCPQTKELLDRTGKDMNWLTTFLRRGMHNPQATHEALIKMNGGYEWNCNGDAGAWITSSAVQKALHLESVTPGASSFDYVLSGPASITLYPELVKKLRVLIYNGQADACVPYIGNEDWIALLESQGVLKETTPWTPWFTSSKATAAGYSTSYSVTGAATDFKFQTVRLAGHMVPQFAPEAGFVLFSEFVAGSKDAQLVV